MMLKALGRIGSFVKLVLWVGLCGFANVPNVGWQSPESLRDKKCGARAFRSFSLSVLV